VGSKAGRDWRSSSSFWVEVGGGLDALWTGCVGCPRTVFRSGVILCLLSLGLSRCQFNDQLISPKHFVHLAGKSTLKDWKRAIRLGGIMLRYLICLPLCPAPGLRRCSCRIPSRRFVCFAVPGRSLGRSRYLASSLQRSWPAGPRRRIPHAAQEWPRLGDLVLGGAGTGLEPCM